MKFLKGFLKLLIVSITIIAIFLPVAVVVHEGAHYILFSLEGIPVTSFHVLDSDSLQNGRYGFVTTTKESRYEALVQEGVTNIFAYLFLATTLLFCLLAPLKPFTVRQLGSMGLKRNSHQFCVPSI
ncbi:MAG: hypothetical protein NTY91_07555 [Euryarchaeota archaeon]|jgi:hypothetical protein|nr:hypothetical protein [Euryarchaeota archaeon]